jgi:hypothetical protein
MAESSLFNDGPLMRLLGLISSPNVLENDAIKLTGNLLKGDKHENSTRKRSLPLQFSHYHDPAVTYTAEHG